MEKLLKFILITCIAVNYIGCGVYGFRGNNPPPGISSLAVPTFIDVSGFSAPALAESFTQSLKNKIINDNTFRLADKNIADAILKCNITSVTDEALVIGSGENVSKRKITINVGVYFENLKTQKKIWEKNFQNYGEYPSSGASTSERQTGIDIAIERITEDIIIDLTSSW